MLGFGIAVQVSFLMRLGAVPAAVTGAAMVARDLVAVAPQTRV